jgi:hypothetical protein
LAVKAWTGTMTTIQRPGMPKLSQVPRPSSSTAILPPTTFSAPPEELVIE